MFELVEGGRNLDNFFRERLHGLIGLLGRDLGRGPGPHIPDRHASKTGRVFLSAVLDRHLHIDEPGFVHHAAAKLQRRPKRTGFESDGGVNDPDISRLGHNLAQLGNRETIQTVGVGGFYRSLLMPFKNGSRSAGH